MFKNQKQTIILDVKIVDNLLEMLSWITTTISFWKLENKWPMNLIKDTIDEIYCKLNETKQDIHCYIPESKNVSVSHINDK